MAFSLLPDDLWYVLCGHLPARDLLAFSRCFRQAREVCLALVKSATVVSPDGVYVQVFLNAPTAPPSSESLQPFTQWVELYDRGPLHLAG